MIWGYILACVTALLLIRLTHKESEMRNSQLSGYVFAVLFLASLFLHTFGKGHVVVLLILLSYFPLFSCYEVQNPTISSFVSFLLVGLAALVIPTIKWLIPFYWIALVFLRAFSIKSFAASILGIMVPWLWLVSLRSAGLDFPYLHHCFSFRMSLGGYGVLTTYQWIMATGMCLLFLYSSGLFNRITYFAKSKTRVVYRVIAVFCAATILFMLINPAGFMIWYPLVLLNVSLIFSRLLDRKI